MKRLLAIFMIFLLVAALITGCGGKKTPQPAAGNDQPAGVEPAQTDTGSGKDAPKGDNPPGTELSAFVEKYMDAKSKLWEAMSAKFEEEENFSFIMGSLGAAFADLLVIEIMMFDMLSVAKGGVFSGALLSGIEAWKKVDGDFVEFGYDHVYNEESHSAEKGDRHIAKGKLDIKADSVTYEVKKERDGKVFHRYIVEITKNNDRSYSSQILVISDSSLNGYLTWFEGENISTISAGKENVGVEFSVNSIFGKKNMTAEKMAEGMVIQSVSSMTDGVTLYETY